MARDRCCSGSLASDARPARARAAWLGVPGLVLAAAAPKCPLCLAAYLSIFGVSAAAAGAAAPLLRPIGLALVAVALGALVVAGARRVAARRRGR